jgi:FkbM family methyltransferase
MIFIDGGACTGQTIRTILHNTPDAVIHAFEPRTIHCQTLQADFGTKPNIIIVPFAISNFTGTKELLISAGNTDMLGATLRKDKYDRYECTEVVNVMKLSDYWKAHINARVHQLKLNIEGEEYSVIEDLLDAGIINEFDEILYEDHGKRGNRFIKSVIEQARKIYPRFKKEYTGTITLMKGCSI